MIVLYDISEFMSHCIVMVCTACVPTGDRQVASLLHMLDGGCILT